MWSMTQNNGKYPNKKSRRSLNTAFIFMKILFLHNNSGSRYYRGVPQMRQLQQLGHKVLFEPHDAENLVGKIEWCDIVIFEMIFSQPLIDLAKQLKKKIIFEIDDLIHIVPKDHYSYKETGGFKNRIKWWWRMYRIFRLCDLIITTNKELARKYGWLAKRSFVFRNFLDIPHWLKEYHQNTTDRIRILWAGSTSHTPDLKMIEPVMKKILEKYPQVQFTYIGHGGIKSQDPLAQFVYGKDLFTTLPDNQREAMLSYPPNVWPYILATLQADIAIAPLEKNEFNRYKSTCKYLEYSVNKIPAVYSKWFYQKDVKHGYNGLLADTPEEWYLNLQLLIENVKIRKQIGENAFKEVLDKDDIRKYIDNWADEVLK